jgi:hypothetical protein
VGLKLTAHFHLQVGADVIFSDSESTIMRVVSLKGKEWQKEEKEDEELVESEVVANNVG